MRPIAQVAVVWAKDEEGEIRGLIVERGMEGFTTPTTHGKWSLRASATGELVFDNVKVPKVFYQIKKPCCLTSTTITEDHWAPLSYATVF